MAINIKNPEVENSIQILAARLGIDLTLAVGNVVNHELERWAGNSTARLGKMRAIADRIAALPLLDRRTDDEILRYDDKGLPS